MNIVKTLAMQLAVWTMLLGPLTALAGAAGTACPRDGPMPDLVVMPGSYRMEPVSPTVGDEVTSFFTVKNQGDADAVNFTVDWFVNVTDSDHFLHSPPDNNFTIGILAAGDSQEVSMKWASDAYVPGINYTIIIVVNLDRTMAESDYTNDRGDQNITVQPRPPIDFYPRADEVWFTPSPPLAGDNITITATVHNGGQGNARFVDVLFYLNDTDHPLSSFSTISELNGSSSRNVSTIWRTGDALLSAGPYFVLIYVNPPWSQNFVNETNYTNNLVNVSVTLGQKYPDLAVANASWLPAAPDIGTPLVVTALIENLGNGASPVADVGLFLDPDVDPVATVQAPALESGANATVQLDWNTTGANAGAHRFHVEADPALLVADSNRSNNAFTWTMDLVGPDLALANVSWMPDPPDIGTPLVVTAEVDNAGNGDSPVADVGLFLDYDVEPVVTTQAPALESGANATIQLVWNTTGANAGAHRFHVEADPAFLVADSNRSNNAFTWTMDLVGHVDLALEALNVTPDSPRPGENVTFSVSVVNVGSLRCNSANLTLTVGGSVADHFQLLALAAGGVLNASLKWTTAGLVSGQYGYEVRVAAGPGDNDTDASNDALGGTITLLPQPPMPDLRIRSIGLSEQTVRTGDPLTLTVVIENDGNLDANASAINIMLESSAGRLFRFTDSPVVVPGIAAGGAVTVTILGDTSRFSADNYTLNATADFNSEVAESNESNNGFMMALSIEAPLPKLPVISVDDIFVAGVLEEGRKVDLIVVVNNSGDAPAMDLVITFTVDGSVAGTQDIDQVGAHTIRNATLTWTFSPGKHTVGATVSATGVQAVSDERAVSIQSAPSQSTNYFVAVGLAVVLILLAAVVARAYMMSRSPGPKVTLVEEEE